MGWDLCPFIVENVLQGAIMSQFSEVHASITKALDDAGLAGVISGYSDTNEVVVVYTTDTGQHEFVGFISDWTIRTVNRFNEHVRLQLLRDRGERALFGQCDLLREDV
jgi:hypothetical protein